MHEVPKPKATARPETKVLAAGYLAPHTTRPVVES